VIGFISILVHTADVEGNAEFAAESQFSFVQQRSKEVGLVCKGSKMHGCVKHAALSCMSCISAVAQLPAWHVVVDEHDVSAKRCL
jgi:hypothetical protein